MALRYIKAGREIDEQDIRIMLLHANALRRLDNKKGALLRYEKAMDLLKSDASKSDAASSMQDVIDALAKEIERQKPPPVEVEDRLYKMPDGTAAVVVSVREDNTITKLALYGGHDPDNGKQDGIDDGIIEVSRDGLKATPSPPAPPTGKQYKKTK